MFCIWLIILTTDPYKLKSYNIMCNKISIHLVNNISFIYLRYKLFFVVKNLIILMNEPRKNLRVKKLVHIKISKEKSPRTKRKDDSGFHEKPCRATTDMKQFLQERGESK